MLTAAVVYLPVGRELVGTAPLDAPTVALLLSFASVVWGVDELDRLRRRRRHVRTNGALPHHG